ncbi:NAD(P)-dependent oxidoreductase [Amycolatopsis rubida]|uniref:3-hydroxyisobutyrate dehydrogenase n=1 Tax=Amycolatopsis rubida TaxID=112413 RepID=A0A1I5TH78_9PSEU|nr:NAD(P)-dependent oxidoreductase [Amycolatopsis rubida]SFP82432.1 3-hydroxyisobutyrate dehydrogenase [Amycolatopsis rubida]
MRSRRIAVIGLGAMGSGMACALVDAGFSVTVFNRTGAKAERIGGAGVAVARSAAEAGADAGVVLLSLADEAAVAEVLFDSVLGHLEPGTTVIDTTTVSPAFARQAAERCAAAGARRVEACVVGNPHMAAVGELRIFTAGDRDDVEGVCDVLGALSKEQRFVGEPGRASVLKLAFNLLLGVQTVGLAEAVAFAEAMGLDREVLLHALENSGWRSPVLSFRAQFIRRRVYQPPGFRAALMHKDLSLGSSEADKRGADLPVVKCSLAQFESLLAAGRGDDDAAAVVDVRSKLTGLPSAKA